MPCTSITLRIKHHQLHTRTRTRTLHHQHARNALTYKLKIHIKQAAAPPSRLHHQCNPTSPKRKRAERGGEEGKENAMLVNILLPRIKHHQLHTRTRTHTLHRQHANSVPTSAHLDGERVFIRNEKKHQLRRHAAHSQPIHVHTLPYTALTYTRHFWFSFVIRVRIDCICCCVAVAWGGVRVKLTSTNGIKICQF